MLKQFPNLSFTKYLGGGAILLAILASNVNAATWALTAATNQAANPVGSKKWQKLDTYTAGPSCTCSTTAIVQGASGVVAGQEGCANCVASGSANLPSGAGVVYYENVDPTNSLGFASGMKMWFYHNNSSSSADVNNKVLVYNANSQGATRGTAGTSNSLINALSGGGLAGNGLYYTGTNAPYNIFYALASSFGILPYINATCNYVNDNMNTSNVCAVLGMRLPRINETQATNDATGGGSFYYSPCGGGNINGVPYSSVGFYWTATAMANTSGWSYVGSWFWVWGGSSASGDRYNLASYAIRCIH